VSSNPKPSPWRKPFVVAAACGFAAALAMFAHTSQELAQGQSTDLTRARALPLVCGYFAAAAGLLITAASAVRRGELRVKDVVLALAWIVVPSAFFGSCVLSFALSQ
jgi:hypothetical protein